MVIWFNGADCSVWVILTNFELLNNNNDIKNRKSSTNYKILPTIELLKKCIVMTKIIDFEFQVKGI